MDATNGLANWWFTAGRVGGWAVFLLLAMVAVGWMIYLSQSRRIPVLGWLLGTLVAGLWLLPSAVLSLVPSVRSSIAHLQQTVVYLGLIGGLVPAAAAIGFVIVHRGRQGCAQGHLYDASLDGCPECLGQAGAGQGTAPSGPRGTVETSRRAGQGQRPLQPGPPGPPRQPARQPGQPPPAVPQGQRPGAPPAHQPPPPGVRQQQGQTATHRPYPQTGTQPYGQRPTPRRPDQAEPPTEVPQRPQQAARPGASRMVGWLVHEQSGRRFKLNPGDTRVGRSRDNEVVLTDPTVSRQHLVIRHQGGRFIIHDPGSTSGTSVNGRRLKQPALLAGGETIVIGETQLRFVKSAASRPSTDSPTRRM